MPVDMDKARLVVATERVSVVCATCERFWEARDQQMKRPDGTPLSCASRRPCGGPMGGRLFPEYMGVLRAAAGSMEAFCFVCGAAATHGVEVQGKAGQLGVCGGHVRLLYTHRSLKVLDGEESPPVLIVTGPEGRVYIDPRIPKVVSTRPKLSEVIAEVTRDLERTYGEGT